MRSRHSSSSTGSVASHAWRTASASAPNGTGHDAAKRSQSVSPAGRSSNHVVVTTRVSPRRGARLSGHGCRSSWSMRMALPRTILRTASSSRPANISVAICEGVGPRRVGVRVVGLEGDVVDADLVERREPVPVAEEAAEHLAVVVGARRFEDGVLHAGPGPVLLPHVVGPFEHVRQPPDLALAVGEAQVRELLELAAEQPVGERRHGVPERQGERDRDGRVGTGGGHLRRRTDVHVDHGAGVVARLEERVPLARVDRRQSEVGRDLAERHRPHAALGVAADLVGRELARPTAG